MFNPEHQQIVNMEEYLEPETLRNLDPSMTSKEIQLEMVKKVVQNTDAVFVNFHVFENAVHALNGFEAQTDHTEGVSVEMIWKALEEIEKLRPGFELSYEVQEYIKFFHKENGLLFYPPLSGIDNPYFEEIKKRVRELDGVPIIIGPDPDPADIQAIRYLRILQYLEEN